MVEVSSTFRGVLTDRGDDRGTCGKVDVAITPLESQDFGEDHMYDTYGDRRQRGDSRLLVIVVWVWFGFPSRQKRFRGGF
jgi:hypothetical protein